MERYDINDHDCLCRRGVLPLHRTPLLQRQSWSLISYLSIAQNPSSTGTVVVAYIISFHCTEPLCYRDSRGHLYHIFPLHRTPLLQGQSWSLISYLSIAQNPFATGTVVVAYIISFHCTEPLCYRDSRGHLYHIFPLHRTPLLQGQSWSLLHDCPCSKGVLGNGKIRYK
jgi:phage shock protein PspC (stress-responsive transcriptional regulator)